MIIPSDPYWVQTLEAILLTNQQLGDELVMLEPAVSNLEMDAIETNALVDQILAHDLQALINTGYSLDLIQAVLEKGVKVLCLAELEYRHPNFISMDNLFEGGRIAGEYIGQRLGGRGRALCVTAGLEKVTIQGGYRLDGFCSALRAYPAIQVEHVPAYWGYSQAYPALLKTFQGYTQPIDAIYGVSDTLILAARDAGRQTGVIDDHTVLVGLNGDPLALAAVAKGELDATIDTAAEVLGATALHMAHQACLGQPVPQVIPQSYRLITRENVDSVAVRKLEAIARIPSNMVEYSRRKEHDRILQLEVTMEIFQQIGALQDRARVFELIGEQVQKYYGYEWLQVWQWSEGEQKLVAFGGSPSPAACQVPVERDELLNRAFQAREMVCIYDRLTSRNWQTGSEWAPVRSRAVLPVRLGEAVIGMLDLQSAQPVRQLTLETIGLKLLASQIGIFIQNNQLYHEALQAREAAERANQLKNRLMANVGHEMRSPLNAILGFSQSIQKQLDQVPGLTSGGLRSDVQNIYRSGEHLMYMINDLLDLSRAEIGALNLYFEPIQPAALLKELFQSFIQSEKKHPQVAWSLDIPLRLPVIRADAVRLRQILLNLLVNARKFTQSGAITLGAAVEPPFMHLWVKDTGPGIPFELQEKIFEPFGMVGRKRRSDGIGLGLSITRHLVALHGGVLTLESQPGEGSIFHVYLPLPGLTQEPVQQEQGGRPVMVIVSRQEQVPEELGQICAQRGLEARVVSCRNDLDQVLREGRPAVIAWDSLHSAPLDWQIFLQLSGRKDCTALPVILYGTEDQSGQVSTGLTNVVFKPFSGNTLKEWLSVLEPAGSEERVILVVDDDAEARRHYQALLAETYPQHSVLMAENGRQALELLETHTPALILLDLMMPEVDGFGVLEKLRGLPRTQNIPVMICSGKLINHADIQRINYANTVFSSKALLTDAETIAMVSHVMGEKDRLAQPTSLLVKQVVAYLHQNYTQPISRKDIAAAVSLSESYVSQIFHQEMSISPWDYLNRFRIYRAKELLLNSTATITRIATQVGFNDSAYFSRVFHKLAGQSPQAFRQSGR